MRKSEVPRWRGDVGEVYGRYTGDQVLTLRKSEVPRWRGDVGEVYGRYTGDQVLTLRKSEVPRQLSLPALITAMRSASRSASSM